LHALAAAAGAVFVEEAGWSVPAHYGDPAGEYRQAREQAVVSDLSHRGKVSLSGPDAQRFLHNLSTNDMARLAVGAGCEALLANAKAKILSRFLAYRVAAAEIWLDLDPGLAERTLKHLDRYLISEQIELADRTAEFAQVGVFGPRAAEVCSRAIGTALPEGAGLHCSVLAFPPNVNTQVRRNDLFGVPAFDIVCPSEHAQAAWQALVKVGAHPAGVATYHVLRVEAGIPSFGQDIDENNLAMEIDRTPQAISYTKGCFPGQEPIVRARDLGHVNWSFRGVKIAGDSPVSCGSKLLRDGKEVGHVTSSVHSPRLGSAIALAYVRRGTDAPGTSVEVAVGEERRSAEISSLPFS
jgi:folate-binding protein YgfZ